MQREACSLCAVPPIGLRWVALLEDDNFVSPPFSLSLPQHMFFFLLQTEQGDIFKVTLESEEDVVSTLTLHLIITGLSPLVYTCPR